MKAEFSGVCPDCDQPIRVGDDIRSGDEGWEHVICPEPNLPPLCTDCYLHHAGECA